MLRKVVVVNAQGRRHTPGMEFLEIRKAPKAQMSL